MKKKIVVLLLLMTGMFLIVNGCNDSDDNDPTSPQTAAYSILGTWGYIIIVGSNVWDSGVLIFTGTDDEGIYTQTNVYNIAYTGNYTVSGSNVTLQRGYDNWQGTFSDPNNISGVWNNNENSGTWTAARQ